MAKQSNILSFDKAKRTAGASRPSVAASKKTVKSTKPSKRQFPKRKTGEFVAFKEEAKRKSSAFKKDTGYYSPRRSTVSARGTEPRRSRVSNSAVKVPQNIHSGDTKRSSRAAWIGKVDLRSAQTSTSKPEPKRRSRFVRFKRERVKTKVNRTFDKQYSDRETSSDASQSDSRAAVYKSEMGATHRRASRMQGSGVGLNADLSSKRMSKGRGLVSRLAAGAAVILCLVLTCAFLYPTAQQYYVSLRECDRLQAEYEAVSQRNAVIQAEVYSLSTDEGVEDRAREEFGWVRVGEHAVNIYGTDATEEESTFSANIVTGSIETPETWYSVWMDPLFGVE